MNIWIIAWKSIQQRGLASFLTGLSMAIGVTLVVMVLSIHGIVSNSFNSNRAMGYNMIVGARGGPLQLVLNTVFYLSKPVQTIPYEYYLAFEDASLREIQMRHSFAYQSQVTHNQTQQMLEQLSLGLPGGAGLSLLDEVTATATNDFAVKQMRMLESGTFSLYAKMAIPICMGDTYGEASQYRVVATTPAFFTELEIDVDTGSKLAFSQGRPFDLWNTTNGVLEAVVGSQVAANENIKLGDPIKPIHGDIGAGGHIHRTEFIVVGILAPSGTRNDAAVFINMEGFYMMDEHRKPLEDERKNVTSFQTGAEDHLSEEEFQRRLDEELEQRLRETEESAHLPPNESSADPLSANDPAGSDSNPTPAGPAPTAPEANDKRANDKLDNRTDLAQTVEKAGERSVYGAPLPIEQRELTAILLRSQDEMGASLNRISNAINLGQLENEMDWTSFSPRLQQRAAQTATPVEEIRSVLDTFVTPVQWLVLGMTVTICVVSGIGILVSIYNSMSERRQEIAVMRALGADQSTVTGIILAESVLLAVGGGSVGWVVAHIANGLLSPWVSSRTGVVISVFDFAPGWDIEWSGLSFHLSSELLLVPGLIFLAVLVGLLPAITAYRLDVSENLT